MKEFHLIVTIFVFCSVAKVTVCHWACVVQTDRSVFRVRREQKLFPPVQAVRSGLSWSNVGIGSHTERSVAYCTPHVVHCI